MLHTLSSASEWQWRLRFDWDVVQRCLFVIGAAMTVSTVLNTLPECLGLWAQSRFVEFWMTVAVVAAVVKSAAQLPVARKTVLITGCDTGFGKALAKHLHGLGFEVFAGCLLKDAGGAGAKELAAVGPDRLHVLQLDVTKESDWIAVKEYVDRRVGHNGLWGIVNNAGWATYGEVEWVQMDTYRKIWEINVLGVIRGVQIVLPLLRKSKGRVVSITSGLARMAVPTRSPYVSSKYAIEGFSDCLRYEMEPFGVHVGISVCLNVNLIAQLLTGTVGEPA
jgi:NAD(P)-dependent dehydrogenase (short-subunit alcohol dehydrogenase family)